MVFAELAVRAPAPACNRAVSLYGLCVHIILMAHKRLFTLLIRSPIQRMTGTAIELPIAL
jgi:hypothetical protein